MNTLAYFVLFLGAVGLSYGFLQQSVSATICAVLVQNGVEEQECTQATITRANFEQDLINGGRTAVSQLSSSRVCPVLATNVTLSGTGTCRYVRSNVLLTCTASSTISNSTTLSLAQFRCLVINGGRNIFVNLVISRDLVPFFTAGKKRRDVEDDIFKHFDSQCKVNRQGRTEYVYRLKPSLYSVPEENIQIFDEE